ncbi:MAG TPA: aminopeptidase [Vicinamibacterales bacterium]|jgi:leucyl aminopeptidase (aminopeptidase T)
MTTSTLFGPFSPELTPGARNAVDVCLAIAPRERVALIADEPSREVAASLEAALEGAGAVVECLLVEQLAPRPLAAAPSQVLQALERADAGILCVQPLQGELAARMRIVEVVERRQIRYAHMVGVTPLIMQQGMRADYREVDRLSSALCERMRTASALRVETEQGTSLTATFEPTFQWVKTSGIISPRYWSNLPAGEVFTTPKSVDGVFICNGTAGDYFGPKYGDLSRTPLTLEIARGRLVAAHCERAELQREFLEYCHTDEFSDRVGELAFGTNLALSRMIGILLQDEKVPGVHLAFGDPYGSQTGAPWKSRTHVDVLTRDCDVWIDDDMIIRKGRYLIERLEL